MIINISGLIARRSELRAFGADFPKMFPPLMMDAPILVSEGTYEDR